ncbi:MAG TPA: WYL domain-containing protein [Bacillota bacterium]|nr:WYL domain-containing protein [Bacillota bacterium]
MSKSPNQKLKLLYLARILTSQTDEEHPMTLEQIKDALLAYDVQAERKSLYDDMEGLRTFGLDVQTIKSKTTYYYIGSRDFELPELKLLVDSVQSNQFLTTKKTYTLIKKLESLCSKYEAQLMRRQVYVTNRVKTMNESIFYNVDGIHSAIAADKQITFRYYEIGVDKEKHYKHDAQRYRVSPFALLLSNENYYMIAYDAAAGILKHYRVDKMDGISVTKADRVGKDAFASIRMDEYTQHTFGMFGGEKQKVTIEFANHLAGVVMDRFGKDTAFCMVDEKHFRITADVTVSPQFFGWVFALGTDAWILAPTCVTDGMRKYLNDVSNLYK